MPRAELEAMMMLTRIMMMAVRAAAFKCSRFTVTTNSASCQAALQRSGAELNPYSANRVSEIKHNLAEVARDVKIVEGFTHVKSKLNPADIGTRSGIKLSELGEGSIWQDGPGFLLLPRKDWPVTAGVIEEAPKEELRKRRLDGWRGLVAAAHGATTARPEEDEGNQAPAPAETEPARASVHEQEEGNRAQAAPGPAPTGAELTKILAPGQEKEEVRIMSAPGSASATGG